MSEGTGWNEFFVQNLENHSSYLELYPYTALEDVAKYLKVPQSICSGNSRAEATIAIKYM